MRQKILFLLVISLSYVAINLGQVQVADGQNEANPRYAFAFQDEMRGISVAVVAVLDSENEWTLTQLPVTIHSPYLPVGRQLFWSADGRTLYGIEYERVSFSVGQNEGASVSYGRKVVAFEYPDWQVTRTIEVLPPDILQDYQQADTLYIQDVSPNGRYAWLKQTADPTKSTIVDVVNGEIVIKPDCWVRMLGWLGDHVVIHCPSEIYTLNLTSLEKTILQPSPPAHAEYSEITYVPQWNAILLGGVGIPDSAMLNLDGSGGFYLSLTEMFGVSADGRYLAYTVHEMTQHRLVRLDLQTGVPEALDVHVSNIRWEGDTLHYEKEVRDEVAVQVIRVTIATSNERHETLISSVPLEDAPYRPELDRLYRDRSVNVAIPEIYQNGELLWRSSDVLPNCNPSLINTPSEPIWGRYVWMVCENYGDAGSTVSAAVAVLDLTTLELIPTPDERWYMDGVSPDGEWFLYVPYNTYDRDAPRRVGLFAYHPASDTRVTFIEEMEQPRSINDPHPQLAYTWSPLFDD